MTLTFLSPCCTGIYWISCAKFKYSFAIRTSCAIRTLASIRLHSNRLKLLLPLFLNHFTTPICREGKGTAVDIPRSVAHLAVAASWGHVRSLNFLSHALYDADSWLMQYGREQVAVRRQKAMLNVLTRDDPVKTKAVISSGESGTSSGVDASGTGKAEAGGAKIDPLTAKLDPLDPNFFNATANRYANNTTKLFSAVLCLTYNATPLLMFFNLFCSTQKSHDEARVAFTDALLRSSLVFNELELIKIYLPDGTLVPLPYPLGSPEGMSFEFMCNSWQVLICLERFILFFFVF